MEKTITEYKNSGLTALRCPTPQFKTSRLALHFVLPLETAERASVRAVVPSLISRVTREFPDYTALGRYLQELYGASLHSNVSRMGDNQVLTVAVSGIANRYAYGGEDVERAMAELVRSAVTTPLFDADGELPADGFQQERRQLIETLESEYNEKRIYAKNRCTELLFAGEPAGVPRLGTAETLSAVRREDVKAAWAELLQNASVYLFGFGSGDDNGFAASLAERLGNRNTLSVATAAHPAKENQKEKRVTEEMPLAQSKLVLGFRMDGSPVDSIVSRMLAVVFGGTPSSKLFLQVREKQSLCYYCSARFETMKNVIFVESGVETADLDRAEAAILAQMDAIRRGEITDEELLHAKLAVKNSCNAVSDSAPVIENWYFGGMLSGDLRSPEAYAEAIMKVTKEQIVEAAQHVALDTVYRLKGVSA